GDSLAGDHIFPGNRPVAKLDPNLPIGIRISKREVLAFVAIDDAAANILGLHHVLDELIVHVGQEKIGAGSAHIMVVAQLAYDLVDRSGGLKLRIGLEIFSIDRESLAIKSDINIRISASSTETKLVRSPEQELTRACELNFLQIGRDDFDIGIKGRHDGF